MSDFLLLVLAFSLSMDAFSLSLAYGTLNLEKKDRLRLSLVVGLYHFFMPLLGLTIGKLLFSFFPVDLDFIILIVLGFIGIEMIIESFKEIEVKQITKKDLLFFGFAVSLDSFSVGIGIQAITSHFFLASFLFSFFSFFFTYIGLFLGHKAHERLGKVSTFFGGIVLIIIGFFAYFH